METLLKRILCLTLISLLANCAQTSVKQPVTEGQQALKQGIDLLSSAEVTDKGEALSRLEQACELGNLYGCHKVGIVYNNGLYGRAKDYQQALEWYLKVASRGYVPSQQNIANLYAHRLITMNDIEGYKWLKLAEQGASQCLPGTIEVESNTPEIERRRLCSLASAGQGHIRSIFRQRMSSEEIQAAEEKARLWRPQ